ncbi:hypothetical protein K160097B7_17310 [[Clostridium] hylemonae]
MKVFFFFYFILIQAAHPLTPILYGACYDEFRKEEEVKEAVDDEKQRKRSGRYRRSGAGRALREGKGICRE